MNLAKVQKFVGNKQNDTKEPKDFLVVYQCSNCCNHVESFNSNYLQYELFDSIW